MAIVFVEIGQDDLDGIIGNSSLEPAPQITDRLWRLDAISAAQRCPAVGPWWWRRRAVDELDESFGRNGFIGRGDAAQCEARGTRIGRDAYGVRIFGIPYGRVQHARIVQQCEIRD